MSSTKFSNFQKKFFNWTSQKTTLFTIIFLVLMLLIWMISSAIVDTAWTIPKNSSNTVKAIHESITSIIAYALPVALMLILLLMLGIFKQSGFTFKNMWKAFWRLSYELVIVLIMLIVFVTALSKYLDPNAFKGRGSDLAKILILQAVAFLFTGLFEEILYRGFILNAILSKWGNSRQGIIKAVLISSAIFGATHMINLLAWVDEPSGNFVINGLIPTIFQSLMAFTFGIYFGLIYLKTNNLIACIIMHTLFDFLVSLISLFEAKDVDGNTLFSILFPAMVLVVEASGELTISYFVLKKTNWEKIILSFPKLTK